MSNKTADRRPIPAWLLKQESVTTRGWKARKRRELRRLRAAYDEFRMGCAYTPGTKGEVDAIHGALKSLEKSLSIKEWGR